jgi:hypothetical protein
MRLYAGIDLHANSHYLGVIDEQSKLLFKHKMVNNLRKTLSGLESFRSELMGVVIESTFNGHLVSRWINGPWLSGSLA